MSAVGYLACTAAGFVIGIAAAWGVIEYMANRKL